MGNTVIEKIIRHNTGKDVKPGDIVTVNVDRVMIHDIFIPFVGDKFEEMGFTKLWDPDKVVLIYDHLVPASQVDDTRHFHKGDEFAKKYGMKNDRGRLRKTGRRCFRNRQPHDDIRLCRCILFRNWLHRDGEHPWNGYDVDQSAGDDQSCHRRRAAEKCDVKRHYPASDR